MRETPGIVPSAVSFVCCRIDRFRARGHDDDRKGDVREERELEG
jgi:hypothetical protein